jgi:hypothetical protein
LKPKKVKDLIPKLASELQLSEQEVKSVLDVYWDKIRKTLSSLEHNRVYLRGLGTFYLKPWAVDKTLRMNDAMIDKYTQNPTPGSLAIMNNVFKDNIKLNRVKEIEQGYQEQWKKKRDERRNPGLEGEEQDS